VHFCREKRDFDAKRGKNPNFSEMKPEAEKRRFGTCKSDYCKNQGATGERKGLFARFEYQNTQKKERQLCIKVDVLRWCGKQDLNLHES
jgi:hypothetical protein